MQTFDLRVSSGHFPHLVPTSANLCDHSSICLYGILLFLTIHLSHALVLLVLSIHHFIRRRITFARHLETSGLNMSRYLRLIMMAISELVVVIASTTASLVFSVKVNYRPWTNWNDVHWNFSRIDRFPAAFLPPSARQFYVGLWWIIPVSSILFFLFFGFGQEAVKEYSACFAWIRTRVLRLKPEPKANPSMGSRGIGRFVNLPQK